MRTWTFPTVKTSKRIAPKLYSLFKMEGKHWIRISDASYTDFSTAAYIFQHRAIELVDAGKGVAIKEVVL